MMTVVVTEMILASSTFFCWFHIERERFGGFFPPVMTVLVHFFLEDVEVVGGCHCDDVFLRVPGGV